MGSQLEYSPIKSQSPFYSQQNPFPLSVFVSVLSEVLYFFGCSQFISSLNLGISFIFSLKLAFSYDFLKFILILVSVIFNSEHFEIVSTSPVFINVSTLDSLRLGQSIVRIFPPLSKFWPQVHSACLSFTFCLSEKRKSLYNFRRCLICLLSFEFFDFGIYSSVQFSND